MINYFIINKLGTVLYQSAQGKRNNSNTGSINESQRIRYLPLLVIKDLIKANLNNVIQYIQIGNKTVAFREQQNLLYVACTKKTNMPINLLQLHLKVMHHFIKFHYGPHWSLQIGGNARSSKLATISMSEIRTCLSQLPFLSTCGKLSIRSSEALCASEQVQVSEDLRFRLTESLRSSCNSTFIHQTQYHAHHHHHHRNSFFSSRNKHHSFDLNEATKTTTTTTTTWAYCFLFAREKLVAQCRNSNTEELPDEFVYFLKLLVSHYLQEKHESGIINTIRSTTLPQNISSNSTTTTTSTITSGTATTVTTTALPNNVSPSSSNSATTTTSSSHQSSLAYVYDANSSSTPFKIREKSASSVTVVSSDSSISYWSNPLSNNLTHHLITSLPHDIQPSLPQNNNNRPSNVLLIPNKQQQQSIADILNIDDTCAVNNNMSFLSSSVPSETTQQTHKTNYHPFHPGNDRIASAPSSPTHRSRSQSLSSNTNNEDSSLKHILANLINGETSYLDQTEDVKLVRRWIKSDGHVYLANFIIILLSDGLCSIVVCKDDPDKNKPVPSKSPWKPMSSQVKLFKSQLRSSLSDFTTFILTKEATHFTNLSFAVTYPGLIHFVHLDRGVMVSPRLVDLNELDKNHELLHEVYGRYYNTTCTDEGKWKWPTETNLKKLCNQMLQLGISFRLDTTRTKAIKESSNSQYYFLYQKGPHPHQELLAIYFSIVPPDRLWSMHQKLLNDICQRTLSTSSSSLSL